MKNMYEEFMRCVRENDYECMETIAKNIEDDINKAMYKGGESDLKDVYAKLLDLKNKLVQEESYNNYMEKGSVYFYTGMIYAYFNICGLYYTMLRKEKDKVEIKEFNKDCYEKLKNYLVNKGKVSEDVVEEELGISKNRIMSCVNCLLLAGEREINMDMDNGKIYYYLDSTAQDKISFKQKLSSTSYGTRIEF